MVASSKIHSQATSGAGRILERNEIHIVLQRGKYGLDTIPVTGQAFQRHYGITLPERMLVRCLYKSPSFSIFTHSPTLLIPSVRAVADLFPWCRASSVEICCAVMFKRPAFCTAKTGSAPGLWGISAYFSSHIPSRINCTRSSYGRSLAWISSVLHTTNACSIVFSSSRASHR
jgi:hypothetical protein